MGTYENTMKTHALRGNLLETHRNTSAVWEPIEKLMKTHISVWSQEKRKGHIGFAWEPIEHLRKTLVLFGSQCNTRSKRRCYVENFDTHGKHKCCVGT